LLITLEVDGAALAEENTARVASAMQFFRGLRDHASLITRARKFVFAWLSAAVAGGDDGRAIARLRGLAGFRDAHLL
jgi:hypothetical protein